MSRSAIAAFAVMVAAGFAGCASIAKSQPVEPPAMTRVSFAAPAAYRVFPGDTIEVTHYSAPELSRTVTVQPDGRIDLPMLAPILVADLTAEEIEETLTAAYAPHLRTPEIEVAATGFGSQQIFVGGEVERPGVYPLPAGMDPLQAIAAAGGFEASARRGEVLIISRAPGAEPDVRVVDLSNASVREGLRDAPTLRRFDVVYVPRSRISQLNLFMQQYVRDALPIQFSLFYDLRGGNN
jgi:polysaccharide export outer membrane protein